MEKNLRNILVVSCGFFLNFTAFGGLQNLQSSLYSEEGLGVATLSTIYCSMMLSSMFLSPLLIKKFGCKWTMVGSMCCYVTFSMANFYATWYTLIPTSIMLGLGAAPLWASQCTYITIVGNLQAKKEGKLSKDVVNQYFGIFFLVFQSSGVWGNLISSLVFSQTPTHALYGVLFEKNKEAAFANYRLGESLGYAIAFGYSSFLCVSTKLYILLGILIVTMMAYGIVEYLEPRTSNKSVGTEEKIQAEKEEMKTEE
ncbi:protein unc-93 homolog A [Onychomys torridus]|uniref:protein unc-93 homolog A n=1 Tax=Onychomys torridus TaxID=38674 RepID=UPI00167FB468|nr:protein unc-93 homolog A [Onychomys torridus]